MPRKKVDSRVRTLIENGIKSNTRSVIVVVGDEGRNQVMNLHHMLTKSRVKARPSVLWCYKKELGFSTAKKKRMRQVKKLMARGLYDPDRDDPFELFVASTKIRWAFYRDSAKILGTTFGMCVLQDFEALTPNLLCRTIETVEGGGLVVLLLHTMKSLKQLFTMTMDVHKRFRTEAHQHVVKRFNERFILSLSSCKSCLVLDDELNVLPISKHARNLTPLAVGDASGATAESAELTDLKASLEDTELVGSLVSLCKTTDQAKATLTFVEAISEKSLRSTVALTAGRGRGKSAALGIAIAAAIGYGYANIFVTSPSPENLHTLFEFVFKGLDALAYSEHMDYEAVQSTNPEFNHAIVRVNVFRAHRQTIQYVHPHDADKVNQAELVVIDEAAAIPLPVVKRLLGPYLVFMASTINGYEGTGRSLSLKLLDQLRKSQDSSAVASAGMGWWKDRSKRPLKKKQEKTGPVVPSDPWAQAIAEDSAPAKPAKADTDAGAAPATGAGAGAGAGAGVGAIAARNTSVGGRGRVLREVTLNEPIRYAKGDQVEAWLHELLCLDVTSIPYTLKACPNPNDCDLFCVDRDALFSYHKMSEAFLQRMMSLYVSSHYKNSPNDLQLMSDAPAHRLFVLLGPVDPSSGTELPDVLCVIQVSLEGHINKDIVTEQMRRGQSSPGDLIPWTISQQFQDEEFAGLSGARIVRIATHPSATSMGYGRKAMELLARYYQGEMTALDGDAEDDATAEQGLPLDTDYEAGLTERLKPRKKTPPLLVALSDRRPTRLHWMGVSFGLNPSLFRFWQRCGYTPLYLRQTANDITGEHTSVMLRPLNCEGMEEAPARGWLSGFTTDFARRLAALLSFRFRHFDPLMAYQLLTASVSTGPAKTGVDEDSKPAQLKPLDPSHLWFTFVPADLKRLEAYSRQLVDHHLIMDLVPRLTLMYFMHQMPQVRLAPKQACVMVGLGLQHSTVEKLAPLLGIPVEQVMGLFKKAMRKFAKALTQVQETEVAATMNADEAAGRATVRGMKPLAESLDAELTAAGRATEKAMTKNSAALLRAMNLEQYAVAGDDADWDAALAKNSKKGKTPSMVSVRAAATATPGGNGASSEKKKRRRKSEGGHPKSAKSKKHKKRHA